MLYQQHIKLPSILTAKHYYLQLNVFTPNPQLVSLTIITHNRNLPNAITEHTLMHSPCAKPDATSNTSLTTYRITSAFTNQIHRLVSNNIITQPIQSQNKSLKHPPNHNQTQNAIQSQCLHLTNNAHTKPTTLSERPPKITPNSLCYRNSTKRGSKYNKYTIPNQKAALNLKYNQQSRPMQTINYRYLTVNHYQTPEIRVNYPSYSSLNNKAKPKTHHKTIMSQYCNTTLPNLHASMSTLNTCKQIQPVNYLTRRTHKLPKLVRTGNHQQHNNITDPPQRTTST
eukprot:gene3550-2501_t